MRIPSGLLFLLVVLVSAAGCANPPSSPTPPSQAKQPIPSPILTLSGYVYDTTFRTVAGATVTVVDGSLAGLSSLTETDGRFSLNGAFESVPTIRVEKEDYVPATVPSAGRRLGTYPFGPIWLEAEAAPANLVGDYSLTLSADPSCDIPSDLRTRNYSATISEDPDPRGRPGTLLVLTVDGASFLANHDRFPIGVAGGTVGFAIYDREDFGLVEQTAPATYLAISGYVAVAVGTSPVATISTPFTGVIDYCAQQTASAWNSECTPAPRVAYARCESQNHHMILNRR